MLKQSQIDLCGRVDFTREVPLLGRDEAFSFACAGCGNCCRGREDIVLSGFDLWRIAARLRLPPRIVAQGYCRESIGQVSRLPVLLRRLEAKLWQALYFDFDFASPFLPQLERNLGWLDGECAKLRGYQARLDLSK